MKTGDVFTNGEFVSREYIWVDGTKPTSELRSKTYVEEKKYTHSSDHAPTGTAVLTPVAPEVKTADGSSTGQAQTEDSEITLKPVRWTSDPLTEGGDLILCEVLVRDEGELVPHWSNERAELVDLLKQIPPSAKPWFGFEQEYFLIDPATMLPLGMTKGDEQKKGEQGRWYCGVGVQTFLGRQISRRHGQLCAKLIAGFHPEVAVGQYEFQTEKMGPLEAADHLILCRYILQRIAEEHDLLVSFDPKPVSGDWNGSGCHTNFSTAEMRGEVSDEDAWQHITDTAQALCDAHAQLVDPKVGLYGFGIEKRLTGAHETCSIDGVGKWAVGARNVAVRIPAMVANSKKGYIEDRRPCANIDPYTVIKEILQITCLNKA